jgi:hypothetical protein
VGSARQRLRGVRGQTAKRVLDLSGRPDDGWGLVLVLVDGTDVQMGEALGPGTQQLDQRVVPESEEQLKRLFLWDGGAVDNDAELALLGAAGEGGPLLAWAPMPGSTTRGITRHLGQRDEQMTLQHARPRTSRVRRGVRWRPHASARSCSLSSHGCPWGTGAAGGEHKTSPQTAVRLAAGGSSVGAVEVAIDRGPADPKGLGDCCHRVLPRAVHLLRHLALVTRQHRWSATVAAAGPGRSQPGGRAFADQVAFQLGQGGEHMEDELPAGGGGVDRLLQAPEPDTTVGELTDGVDQVAQRAPEAVELPHHEGVARAQLVQELLEGGAVGAGAAAVSANTR